MVSRPGTYHHHLKHFHHGPVIIMVQNNPILQRTNVATCISQGKYMVEAKCMGAQLQL